MNQVKPMERSFLEWWDLCERDMCWYLFVVESLGEKLLAWHSQHGIQFKGRSSKKEDMKIYTWCSSFKRQDSGVQCSSCLYKICGHQYRPKALNVRSTNFGEGDGW